MVQLAGAGTVAASPTSTQSSATSSAPTTNGPIITIQGNNPAHITVGQTYSDLGATVSDPVDSNLGYQIFLDGVEVQQVQIDTSVAGTHHIDYTTIDSQGLNAAATRTVFVESASSTIDTSSGTSSPTTTDTSTASSTSSTTTFTDASSTDATSTTP
jgi:hypothetical protein